MIRVGVAASTYGHLKGFRPLTPYWTEQFRPIDTSKKKSPDQKIFQTIILSQFQFRQNKKKMG